jgi:hypothetical protein
MSGPGIVTLESLRIQSQERADQLNSTFLSVSEWNRNIMGSYKELYDLLIAAYGTDYYVNTPVTFQTNNTSQFYPLPDGSTTFTSGITGLTITPPAFYKLLGIDLILGPGTATNNAGSAVTIRPFNFSDRNRYAVPNFQSFYGVTNLRYRLNGNNLWLTPIPASGQVIQIWYVPRPSDIQPEVICGTTSSSTTVTCTDTSNLATGMYVQAPGSLSLFASGTTISSITTNVSFVVSAAATATSSNTLVRAWADSTTIDGVSGWEEYIIVDSALKGMGKEESDVSLLAQQKLAMIKRLQDMANNRDAGNGSTVADVQWSDFYWPTGNGGGWGAF